MSSQAATVLLIVPGRSTVRLRISSLWPYQLLALLLAPVLVGVGARHGFQSWRGQPPVMMLQARELTASIDAAQRATPAGRAGLRLLRRQPPARTAASVDAATAAAPALVAISPAARPTAPSVTSAGGATISAAPIVRAFRERSAMYPDPGDAGATSGEATVLRLHSLHLGEAARVQPFDAIGAPQPEAFAALGHLMRCRATGEEVAIDPRLVRILTQLAADYRRPIQLISGHRSAGARGTSPTSQHTTGRAADIRIAGVTIEELRRRVIDLGARGVGLYPEKGFVHVDVRDRHRFYWIYTEASGEQPYDRFAAAPPLLGAPLPLPAGVADDQGEHGEGE